ncbi:RICIN domain-containing protein [Hymenobacter lucidus]|uniref:RICIN domain-containing protein n=1 Tax=Hymenobacter lucidus TaxID=2880930 RepID=A0ABS8AP31_9BACT|nr:RICIN domain-containing protein [Hymenobacter lucidus]MCB2406757.1 RICIN domain-containing protein [Hymenobacter lucidus]
MKNNYLSCMLLLAGCVFASFQSIAQTFNPNVVYKLANQNAGGIMEIGGGGTMPNLPGTKANMWPYLGTANQEWYIRQVSSGAYTLVNRNSNQVLEIGGELAQTWQSGARANQWGYVGTPNQEWDLNIVADNGGSVQVVEIANRRTGMLLSIDATPDYDGTTTGKAIYQAPRRSGPNYSQRWAITTAGPEGHAGVYTIMNNGSKKFLEVLASRVDEGAPVNQWTYAGNAAEQWIISFAASPNFYSIRNRYSGQALEIGGEVGDTYTQGQKANQWPYRNTDNQHWAIDFTNGIITNRRSGQVLEIGGGSPANQANGARANQWPDVATAPQRWTITRVSDNRGTGVLATTAQQAANQALSLSPNPASSLLTFALAKEAKAKAVTVTDIRGSVVTGAVVSGNNTVDISQVAAGIYILTVSDGEQVYHQKFIKQ